jgi:hypothetical protein
VKASSSLTDGGRRGSAGARRVLRREVERDQAFADLGDVLRGDVLRPGEHGAAVADREAVEDVVLDVARDLVDLADLVALGVDDAPAALDHPPGDEVGHY